MNVAVRPQSLDILSICTGGGGLDLGIELAVPGARSVCLVEREAFAVAHLVAAMEQGLMAPAPVWSDARTFDGRRWRGCVDGLVGGIPCQPHSLAGRKQGSLDHRDLWSDARRIIVQSRCWFVLIENVGGMLSAGADEVAGAERVWRDLRKLGFAVEIGLFTAAEVGASHERERVFILAVADTQCEQWREGWPDARGARRAHAQSAGSGAGVQGVGLADTFCPRLERVEPGRTSRPRFEGSATERDSRALVDAALIGRREGRAEPVLRGGRHSSSGADGTMDDASIARGRELSIQSRRQDEAGRDVDGASHLFPPGPSDRENWQAVLASTPELEPAFRRVADGLASRLDFARVDRLRMLGNGVVPLQAAYAFRTLCHRLDGRGSAGAARLVRMMGDTL